MSYVASIIIRDAAEKPEDVATQAKNLIASRFSTAKKFPSVRVYVTPVKQRRDFGIVEIDKHMEYTRSNMAIHTNNLHNQHISKKQKQSFNHSHIIRCNNANPLPTSTSKIGRASCRERV